MDDLISRQAAIDALTEYGSGNNIYMSVRELKRRIETLPSAQPERKKGKWVLVTDRNGQHFECDQCGEWRYRQKQNFCGECGAYMRGEQDAD